MVEGNIIRFLKVKRYVISDASDDDALDAFDRLVQTTVLRVMQRSLGTRPLPFKHLVAVMLFITIPNVLDIVSGLVYQYGMFDTRTWTLLLDLVTITLAASCYCELIAWLTSKRLHLSGWKERAWVLFCWLGTFMSVASLIMIGELLRSSSDGA